MREMWSDKLTRKTKLFKVFTVIRESPIGLFSNEINDRLEDIECPIMFVALQKLKKKGFISVSKKKYPMSGGNMGHIFGINCVAVQRRLRTLEAEKNNNPKKYLTSPLMREIVELLENERTGFTPAEIYITLGKRYSQRGVNASCVKLFNRLIIKKSPFSLPHKNREEGLSKSKEHNYFVYGIDRESVFRGITRLMPASVKKSLMLIQSSDKIWPCWRLTRFTNISAENLARWFKDVFYKMGIVKFKTFGNVSYYYNSRLPEEIISEQMANLREQSRQWRLNITELGRMFQERAIYIYVEYLRLKGYDIKTVEGFPEKTPNWLNKKTRMKYLVQKEDENGYVWKEYMNHVWKFNSEPVDYIVFVRDKKMKESRVHILTCKRDVSRRYGVNYFTTFIGCVKMGRTKKGHEIPGFLSGQPVFICSETYGKALNNFNDDVKGQAGIILTMSELEKMVEDTGIVYPREEEFQELVRKKEAYDLYSNHEDVLLGNKTVFQMMKERGFKVRSNESRQIL